MQLEQAQNLIEVLRDLMKLEMIGTWKCETYKPPYFLKILVNPTKEEKAYSINPIIVFTSRNYQEFIKCF